MKIKKNNNKYRAFVLGTFGFMLALSGIFVYNSTVEGAFADEYCTTGKVCDTATTGVTAKIGEVLSITGTTVDGASTDTINLGNSVAPGTFTSKTMVVTVATNHEGGYYLQLNGTTNSAHADWTPTALTHANSTTSAPIEISSLGSGTYTESNFTSGAWGYSAPYNGASALGSGNYAAIPSSATTIDKYGDVTAGNATNLTVAVKPSVSNPAGQYTGYLLLTAVGQ